MLSALSVPAPQPPILPAYLVYLLSAFSFALCAFSSNQHHSFVNNVDATPLFPTNEDVTPGPNLCFSNLFRLVGIKLHTSVIGTGWSDVIGMVSTNEGV